MAFPGPDRNFHKRRLKFNWLCHFNTTPWRPTTYRPKQILCESTCQILNCVPRKPEVCDPSYYREWCLLINSYCKIKICVTNCKQRTCQVLRASQLFPLERKLWVHSSRTFMSLPCTATIHRTHSLAPAPPHMLSWILPSPKGKTLTRTWWKFRHPFRACPCCCSAFRLLVHAMSGIS